MHYPEDVALDIKNNKAELIKIFYIKEYPTTEITPCNTDVFNVVSEVYEGGRFTVPAAAVAAVEITLGK